eukprot:TRINITY_DN47314_c1_g1_i1.p1 TRINITY_DN47314_c1_g1~~TRINITY_DN47314_c1_g1_i1.p1  ORF type:complete len:559 (-),score=75.68 TRINITY_DN47314_c1_g1_i1:7-1683(-)
MEDGTSGCQLPLQQGPPQSEGSVEEKLAAMLEAAYAQGDPGCVNKDKIISLISSLSKVAREDVNRLLASFQDDTQAVIDCRAFVKWLYTNPQSSSTATLVCHTSSNEASPPQAGANNDTEQVAGTGTDAHSAASVPDGSSKDGSNVQVEQDDQTVGQNADGGSSAGANTAVVQEDIWEAGRQILRDGALKLLSANWLLSQPADYIIQRRQDLPHEAFLPLEQAADWYDDLGACVVISYPWITKEHPDPTGEHMCLVRKYLAIHLDFKHFRKRGDAGVFWDYASLPQRDASGELTPEELDMFQRGLRLINLLYSAEYSLVIQLTSTPQSCVGREDWTPYYDRGWCFFEATASSLLKAGNYLLDLGMVAGDAFDEYWNWEDVSDTCTSRRRPPLIPDEMQEALSTRRFTNGADHSIVMRIYRVFFEKVTPTAASLNFTYYGREQGWTDVEGHQLARAMPHFKHCVSFQMNNHMALGESAILAIIAALPSLADLSTFGIDGADFSLACLGALEKVLPALKRLCMLFLPRHVRRFQETEDFRRFKATWTALQPTGYLCLGPG